MFIAPIGLWLECPRCKHDVEARDIFRKVDMSRLRPGIVTCPNCGAHFTYGLKGFRIFIITLFVSALICASLPVLQYYFSITQTNIVLGAMMFILLTGLVSLSFAGRRLVD